MGGELRTFYGLSGAGDLIATCFSQRSRNRQVGEHLGYGRELDEITASMGTVAEGIPTARSAFECARKLQVDTPIIDQVYSLLYEAKPPARAMEELLQRDQLDVRITEYSDELGFDVRFEPGAKLTWRQIRIRNRKFAGNVQDRRVQHVGDHDACFSRQ